MKTDRLTFLTYALLGLLTAGYCWLVWLLMGVFRATVMPDSVGSLPWVSRLTMASVLPVPFHALHYQILAVSVLVGAIVWGFERRRRLDRLQAHLLPAVLVVGWVLLSVCWQLVGLLAPMVTTAHVLL